MVINNGMYFWHDNIFMVLCGVATIVSIFDTNIFLEFLEYNVCVSGVLNVLSFIVVLYVDAEHHLFLINLF